MEQTKPYSLSSAPDTEEKKRYTANAIDKTLSVIDFLAKGEASYTDILQALHLPKATLHRILQSLEEHEYISRNDVTDRYSLGIKFIYYGAVVKSDISIVSIAAPHMQSLAASIGERVSMSMLYHDMAVGLVSFEGESSVLISRLIPVAPLNASASGKLFLSYMSDEKIRSYFESSMWERTTVNSICSYDSFKAEQKKILQQGISYDDEESEYGLYCMSIPLSNHEGILPANMGITGPKSRIFMKGRDELEKKLRQCAMDVNHTLQTLRYEFEY